MLRGRSHLICGTTLAGRSAITLCSGALAIGKATITFEGPYPIVAPSVDLAVTGGTGAYAGARGTVYKAPAGTLLVKLAG